MGVLDTEGSNVKTVFSESLLSKGNVENIWTCDNHSGEAVEDGEYIIKYEYEDRAGNLGLPRDTLVWLDATYPVISDFIIKPEKFDPRGEGCKIGYFLSERSYVTLEIYYNGILIDKLQENDEMAYGRHIIEWKGRKDGQILDSGIYEVRVFAKDKGLNKSEVQNTSVELFKDTIPPVIEILNVTPFATFPGDLKVITNVVISPDSGSSIGVRDVAYINYSILDDQPGEISDLTIRVYNRFGILIKTIINESDFDQGIYTNEWNGTDDNGVYVPDGLHTIYIVCYDNSGNRAFFQTAKVMVDNQAPRIFGAGDLTRCIRGGGDEKLSLPLEIREKGCGIIRKLNMQIFSLDNYFINNVIMSNFKLEKNGGIFSEEYTLEFDGKDQFGNYLIDGRYRIILDVEDGGGNRAERIETYFYIDSVPPVVDDVSIDPEIFSPNPPYGDGTRDAAGISYTLTDNVSPEVEVDIDVYSYDGSVGDKIRTINNQHILVPDESAGNYYRGFTDFWDGKNDDHLTVPDGQYIIKIQAKDLTGNVSVIDNDDLIVEVDNTPPLDFYDVTVVPDMISPNNDGNQDVSDITYRAGENVLLNSRIVGIADKYDYTAKGTGIYYPTQDFQFKVKAEGKNLTYEPQNFGFRIDVDGNEKQIYKTKKITGYGSGDVRSISVNKSDGTCWIARNNNIIKLDSNGNELFRKSGFNIPWSVSVNSAEGSCWIADTYNHEIVKLDSNGNELFRISGFYYPWSVSVNSTDGRCWIADTYNNEIVRLDSSGNELLRISGFYHPKSVSVNISDGSCWVADYFHHQIVKLDENGSELFRRGGFFGITYPESISVNSADGSCWVADYFHKKIIKFDSDGNVLFQKSGYPYPVSVSVNVSDGSCWIADKGMQQIVKLASNGNELFRKNYLEGPSLVSVNSVDGTCWGIAYNGKEIVKLDSDGNTLLYLYKFGWGLSSVRVNSVDGSCWIIHQASHFPPGPSPST